MDTASEPKPVVLVVDDDELAAKAVSRVIEKQGFTVLTAYSGKKGLDVLANNAVDVLVLDVMMPEMTGLEVCRELRQDGRFSDLPVILLTGCDDFETRAAGMKLGVSEFLCKPFAHHELIARINNQVEVRRILRQLDTLAQQL
jgi:two-component system response regulator MprA